MPDYVKILSAMYWDQYDKLKAYAEHYNAYGKIVTPRGMHAECVKANLEFPFMFLRDDFRIHPDEMKYRVPMKEEFEAAIPREY